MRYSLYTVNAASHVKLGISLTDQIQFGTTESLMGLLEYTFNLRNVKLLPSQTMVLQKLKYSVKTLQFE